MRIALLLVVAACSKGISADECRTEAEGLSKLLMDTPHEPGAFMPQREVTLVRRTDLKQERSIPYSPVLVIGKDVLVYRGRLLEGKADLQEELTTAHAKLKEYRQQDPARLHFQIDRGVPWSKVVDATDAALAAGFTLQGFAFDTGAKLTPPPRTAIDDKLDALMKRDDAGNKATELAKMISDVIEGCPALKEKFGTVAIESTESKADVLIKGLAPGLIECKCKVDMGELRSVMWRLLAVEPGIQVLLFDAADGDELALPGATTWEEASKKLVVGKRYRFAAR